MLLVELVVLFVQKEKRANSIAKGHANSKVKQEKFLAKIHKAEEKFDISFIGKQLPKFKEDYCRFKCNDCDGVFKRQMTLVLTSKYGCPICAEEIRLRRSMTKKSIELRKLGSIAKTEDVQAKILRKTSGRTSLRSEWKGVSKSRTFKCNDCSKEWEVNYNTDGIYTGCLCQDCSTPKGFSSLAISWLDKEAKTRKIKIRHAKNKGEFRVPGTNYKVDGYSARSNTVFEFHGDAFHGNPKVYQPNSRPHPYNKHTARYLYKKTKERENKIKELGYNLVVMWESDYKAQAGGI